MRRCNNGRTGGRNIYTKRYEVALYAVVRFVIACVPSPLVVFHRNPDSPLYIILIFTSRCFRPGERIRSVLDQRCVHYSYIIAVQDWSYWTARIEKEFKRSYLAIRQYPCHDYEIMKARVNYLGPEYLVKNIFCFYRSGFDVWLLAEIIVTFRYSACRAKYRGGKSKAEAEE